MYRKIISNRIEGGTVLKMADAFRWQENAFPPTMFDIDPLQQLTFAIDVASDPLIDPENCYRMINKLYDNENSFYFRGSFFTS